MPRKAKRGICVSLRLTLDPDTDSPLLEALAATPRGRRAALIRQWLRVAYLSVPTAGHGPTQQENALAWVDGLLGEDD